MVATFRKEITVQCAHSGAGPNAGQPKAC